MPTAFSSLKEAAKITTAGAPSLLTVLSRSQHFEISSLHIVPGNWSELHR